MNDRESECDGDDYDVRSLADEHTCAVQSCMWRVCSDRKVAILDEPCNSARCIDCLQSGSRCFAGEATTHHGKEFVQLTYCSGWVPVLSRKISGKRVIAAIAHHPENCKIKCSALCKSDATEIIVMLNKIREPFDTNCTTPHLASLLLWAIDADQRKRKERGKSDTTVNHHETVICPEYVGTS